MHAGSSSSARQQPAGGSSNSSSGTRMQPTQLAALCLLQHVNLHLPAASCSSFPLLASSLQLPQPRQPAAMHCMV